MRKTKSSRIPRSLKKPVRLVIETTVAGIILLAVLGAFVIALAAIAGCASLPPVPRHVQYGVHADIHPPGFYGVDSGNSARVYKPFDDPSMKAAQCLSAPDFKAMQEWLKKVLDYANQNCH